MSDKIEETVEVFDWRKNRAEKKALREKAAKDAAPVAVVPANVAPAIEAAPVADKKSK